MGKMSQRRASSPSAGVGTSDHSRFLRSYLTSFVSYDGVGEGTVRDVVRGLGPRCDLIFTEVSVCKS